MSTPASRSTLTDAVAPYLSTTAAPDHELASNASRIAWDRLIDSKLIEWGREPSLLQDEHFEAPSRVIVGRAFDIAREFRDGRYPPPLRVLPDGEGGISFEWRDGDTLDTLNIYKDGSVEFMVFRNCVLTTREMLFSEEEA